MKTKEWRLVDLTKVKVDPDMKSSREDPFVVKKVEEAKQRIEELKKTGKYPFLF